jgi:hypothetical protein
VLNFKKQRVNHGLEDDKKHQTKQTQQHKTLSLVSKDNLRINKRQLNS